MAIRGEMKIEGMSEIYSVVECEYQITQKYNRSNGLPISGLEASPIVVTIVTPQNGRSLYEWMIEEFGFKNGRIALNTNVNSKSAGWMYVFFENAKCVGLQDYFNNQSSSMMTTKLTIQPGRIYFTDGEHQGETIGYDFRHKRKATASMVVTDDGKIKLDSDWRERRKDDERAYINSWNN